MRFASPNLIALVVAASCVSSASAAWAQEKVDLPDGRTAERFHNPLFGRDRSSRLWLLSFRGCESQPHSSDLAVNTLQGGAVDMQLGTVRCPSVPRLLTDAEVMQIFVRSEVTEPMREAMRPFQVRVSDQFGPKPATIVDSVTVSAAGPAELLRLAVTQALDVVEASGREGSQASLTSNTVTHQGGREVRVNVNVKASRSIVQLAAALMRSAIPSIEVRTKGVSFQGTVTKDTEGVIEAVVRIRDAEQADFEK